MPSRVLMVLVPALRTPLNSGDPYAQIARLIRAASVLPIMPLILLEGPSGLRNHRLAYRDAMV